ncbi:MAG: ATP-binding protein [Nitrospirales bacterium]
MTDALREMKEQYAQALQGYLAGGGEDALQQAYEMGRQALDSGAGVLDLANMHHAVLLNVLPEMSIPQEKIRTITAAELFLAESLSPFEMSHRSSREANMVLRRLNEMLEEEAKRIAHALHDEAGQLLASVHIALAAVSVELPEKLQGKLQEVRVLLDQIEDQLRCLAHELRPTILDNLGLVPALEFLAQGISKRTGLSIQVEGPSEGRLPIAVETSLYRLVQEALNNTGRHAQASFAVVRIQYEDKRVCCVIRDDGVGFDPSVKLERQGLGLLGMRERVNAVGGKVVINSAPGRGTTVLAEVPLEG